MSLSLIERFSMSVVYLFCGLFLLIGNNIFNFSDFQKNGLGIILLSYGSLRFYLSIKRMTREKDEKERN